MLGAYASVCTAVICLADLTLCSQLSELPSLYTVVFGMATDALLASFLLRAGNFGWLKLQLMLSAINVPFLIS